MLSSLRGAIETLAPFPFRDYHASYARARGEDASATSQTISLWDEGAAGLPNSRRPFSSVDPL